MAYNAVTIIYILLTLIVFTVSINKLYTVLDGLAEDLFEYEWSELFKIRSKVEIFTIL